jgi:hypothetical protein
VNGRNDRVLWPFAETGNFLAASIDYLRFHLRKTITSVVFSYESQGVDGRKSRCADFVFGIRSVALVKSWRCSKFRTRPNGAGFAGD